jgi:hypothetical protein
MFAATLAAFGADDGGAPTALRVLWCGTAQNAAGEALDAAVDLWTPRGFVLLATSPIVVDGAGGGAACVAAATDPGADLAFVPRGDDRTVTVQVRPLLPAAAAQPGTGFASVTTTALEVVAQFGAAP